MKMIPDDYPFIIAIGGSAGSLLPLFDFFEHTPADNATYVILRHIPKYYRSQLTILLKKHCILDLVDVTSNTTIQANKVYIVPGYKNLILEDRQLKLIERTDLYPNYSIDLFFKSLAALHIGTKAIAIVLSGNGMDGTKGVQDIKDAGGIVIVQEPASCANKAMPENAIKTNRVDFIAFPANMPKLIQHYTSRAAINDL